MIIPSVQNTFSKIGKHSWIFSMKKVVAFLPSFGGITAEEICNMNPSEAVDTPILMTGNGCMPRPGFKKMDLKKDPLQI